MAERVEDSGGSGGAELGRRGVGPLGRSRSAPSALRECSTCVFGVGVRERRFRGSGGVAERMAMARR
eukprot:8502656-Alexandrium_andersonii.AAC.1